MVVVSLPFTRYCARCGSEAIPATRRGDACALCGSRRLVDDDRTGIDVGARIRRRRWLLRILAVVVIAAAATFVARRML